MSLSKTTLQILILITIFAGLSGYNFMRAAWTAPTGTPPTGNVSAPVNVGTTTQTKAGNLAVNTVAALTEVRSNRYCDALGENCTNPTIEDPATSDYSFGGMFDGSLTACNRVNPMTGSCSCGADYTEFLINYQTHESNCNDNGNWCTTVVDSDTRYCMLTAALPNENTFITQFSALIKDPAFRAWYGAGAPLPTLPDGDFSGHGWYLSGSTRAIDTFNKICSYMKVDGRYEGSAVYADYGSDHNNIAWEWNKVTSRWMTTSHGNNGAVDAVMLNCIGGAVTPQGNFWRKSVRSEATCGGYRCNPYPVPPMR